VVPQLEHRISEILSTHDQVTKSKTAERDLLEEILQLSRANSSREAHPHRIHRHDMKKSWKLDGMHDDVWLRERRDVPRHVDAP